MERVDIEFVTKEVFKKKIAELPADFLTPQRATRLYADIFEVVREEAEKEKNYYSESFDDAAIKQDPEERYNFR